MEATLWELLKAFGRFFAHPLTYIIPMAMFVLGILRVKRERQFFHIRIHPSWFDVTAPLFPGFLAGMILSFALLTLGIVFPFSFFLIVSGWLLLFIVTGRVRLLSPAYTIGFAGLSLFLLPMLQIESFQMGRFLSSLQEMDGRLLLVFLAFLLIVEGSLIWTNGPKYTSPLLVKSPRGKYIGAHRLQRIWFIPLFLPVPVGGLAAQDWWLFLPTGVESVSLFLVPFAIGAKQSVLHTLPHAAISRTGKKVVILGVVMGAFAWLSYYEERIVPFVLGIVILARIAISLHNYWQARENYPFFTLPPAGIRVLDVLPGSTAEKIGITPGEIIVKANGQPILHERDLYTGIQRNSAYCKLEVKDIRGEVRHVQSAVYANEHHELGILFVSDREQEEKTSTYISMSE